MPEMPDTGEDHCHVALVRGGSHFSVAYRTARLNSGGGAGIRGGDEAVREREKCVARHRAAL